MIYSLGVLFLAAYISSTAALPPCTCTRNLKPVCGTDGQTYNNECLLECARTKGNPTLAVERSGPCEAASAACMCTFDYKPVCGSDGETYPNSCALGCKARSVPLEKVHDGICDEKKVKRETEKAEQEYCECTEELDPMCGTDGKTYPNPCLLDCAKRTNDKLSLGYKGRCLPDIDISSLNFGLPPCTCTRNLDPVCGSDGATYANTCVMKCSGPKLTVARRGSCDGSIQTVVVDDAETRKL